MFYKIFGFIFIITLQLCSVSMQILPINPCQKYFEYVKIGTKTYGFVTLKDVPKNNINLKMQFTQNTPLRESVGSIALHETDEIFIRNLKKGSPVTYRVEFPNDQDIPQVVRLVLNNEVICALRTSILHNTNYQLQHTFLQRNSDCSECQQVETDIRGAFDSVVLDPEPKYEYNPTTCGIADAKAFTYGGSLLKKGQVPWLVSVYDAEYDRFLCGASLVHPRGVITAAHCINNYYKTKVIAVYLGRHNITDYNEEGVITRLIKKFHIHPEFSNQNISFGHFDIAILQLEFPVTFNKYLHPICLWNGSTDLQPLEGIVGFLAGWEFKNDIPSLVDNAILNLNSCMREQKEIFELLNGSPVICASNYDETAPCIGDSGIPLAINRKGRWTIRGILAGSIIHNNTCDKSSVNFFTDIAHHMNWIHGILSKLQ